MFSTGSIAQIGSALESTFDNDAAIITRNVMKRFLDRKPFPPVPANEVDEPDIHTYRAFVSLFLKAVSTVFEAGGHPT
jgi:hypothetical protein